jgi:ferredoxin
MISVFIADTCTACGACVATCPTDALRAAPRKPSADDARCTACLACIEVCPVDAVYVGWHIDG